MQTTPPSFSLALSFVLAPMLVFAQPASTPSEKPAAPATPQPQTAPQDKKPEASKPKAVTPEVHAGTEKRHERFNHISKEGKASLVFLGDSITESWENAGKAVWDKHYAARSAANFGVSGDRTENVLWRLDHGNFDGLKPKLIVIMIGTNNTGHRKDPAADTAAGVQAILDRLKAKCPDSKILLMAIFPRGERASDEMRRINDAANALIEKMADGKKIIYKDIGKVFLDASGAMKKDLMPDLLHPNEKGYALWAEAIESDVAALLDEAKPKSESAPKAPAKDDTPADPKPSK